MSRKDETRPQSRPPGVTPEDEGILVNGIPEDNPVWNTVPDITTGKRSSLEKITVHELIWKMREDAETGEEQEPEVMFYEGDSDDDKESGGNNGSDSGGSFNGGNTPPASGGANMASHSEGVNIKMVSMFSLINIRVNEKINMNMRYANVRSNNNARGIGEAPVPYSALHW